MTKKIFENLLFKLAENGIGEYYMTPGSCPIYRKNKQLEKAEEEPIITTTQTEELMSLLLLEKEEEQLYNTGSFELSYSIEKIGRFRVRFGRQRSSITIVVLVKNTEIPDITSLPLHREVIDNMFKEQGLMIFCGEKKTRKHTTVASLLKHVAENSLKIITTVEDPIEYLLAHGKGIVNQMEVGIDVKNQIIGLNEGVNNNSDIIYLSDISTKDEIKQVFSALEKGFFVVVVMNATSVEATIEHFLYSFDQNEQVHIKRLLANHLISIVCEQNARGIENKIEAIYEVLINNTAVKSMFLENKLSQLESIFEAFPETGMMSMEEAILKAVAEGRISKEEAVSIAKRPGILTRKLNGEIK